MDFLFSFFQNYYYTTKMKTTEKYITPNLEKALQMIEVLSNYPEGLTLAELVNELSIAKTTLFRLTQTLLLHNYLYKDKETSRFYLSRKFLRIGLSALGEESLVENAIVHMRLLRDEIKESVLLGALLETEVALLEQVMGTHPFTFYLQPGRHFNLNASAPGKVLLAFSEEKDRDRIIKKMDFPKFNQNTITTPEGLYSELEGVRHRGFAVDCAEELEGVHCLSAPVFNQNGVVIAAIWTTAPSSRLPIENFESMSIKIKDCALKISRTFGYDL